MFEPIICPIAISLFLLNAATAEVTSSGNDVTDATISNLIIFSLFPNSVAFSMALLTANLPPIIYPVNPITIKPQIFMFCRFSFESVVLGISCKLLH